MLQLCCCIIKHNKSCDHDRLRWVNYNIPLFQISYSVCPQKITKIDWHMSQLWAKTKWVQAFLRHSVAIKRIQHYANSRMPLFQSGLLRTLIHSVHIIGNLQQKQRGVNVNAGLYRHNSTFPSLYAAAAAAATATATATTSDVGPACCQWFMAVIIGI